MRYSIEPIKGCGFLSFARNVGKNISNKYNKKVIDTAKKSASDATKTASKRAIQKTVEATGDLVDKKVADKVTSVSKKPHNEDLQSNEANYEIPKERYISPKEKQQIIDELRLI